MTSEERARAEVSVPARNRIADCLRDALTKPYPEPIDDPIESELRLASNLLDQIDDDVVYDGARCISHRTARPHGFRSLSEADHGAVAAQMREATYDSDQLIFSRGDAGEALYLVVEGRVRLSVLSAEGRVLSFGHAARGDIFGEIAALDGQARTADATALTRATIMVLSRSSLNRLMETRPQLAQAAVDLLCRKLRRTSDQIEAIALHSTQVRLARFLLAAITMKGQSEASGPVAVDVGMSQTELGLLLGASRSKINEALATLEKLGAARHTGRQVECNVRALQDIAQGD